MKELYEALNKVKNEIGTVQKDGKNPFFNSQYLTLAGLLGAIGTKLSDNGLILYQQIITLNEAPHLVTTIKHINSESDYRLESNSPLIGATDMQKMASAITYARRYSIATMLGIIEADDDGEKSMGRSPDQQKKDYFKHDTSKGGEI